MHALEKECGPGLPIEPHRWEVGAILIVSSERGTVRYFSDNNIRAAPGRNGMSPTGKPRPSPFTAPRNALVLDSHVILALCTAGREASPSAGRFHATRRPG